MAERRRQPSNKDEIEIIHDWDHTSYGKKLALKKSLQYTIYVISHYLPFLRKYCQDIWDAYDREIIAFLQLEQLLSINASYCPRVEITYETQAYDLPNKRKHIHFFNTPRPGSNKLFKAWYPGIAGQEEWTFKEINDGRLAMPDLGRPITEKTQVIDIHIKPERRSIYTYLAALIEMRARGLKWK